MTEKQEKELEHFLHVELLRIKWLSAIIVCAVMICVIEISNAP